MTKSRFFACVPTKSAISFCNSLTSFLPSISKLPLSFNSLYFKINSSSDLASSSFCCTFSLVSENAPFTTSPKTEFVNYYVESTNSSIIINVNGIKEDLNVIMIKLESTEYGKPLEIKATCYSNYLTLPMYEYIYGKHIKIEIPLWK